MDDANHSRARAWEEPLCLPTYAEPAAEQLPMFAESRVHQRTSGNPYPRPVVVKVNRDKPVDRIYRAVYLENDYLQVIILPELGGRIFAARDKTTGYDFFYRQHVIKPALIGALGSWISGGVEFNFPYHHRPSTYMPVDFKIEAADDGSVTVWLSEHDPQERIKGMVGISLEPDRAILYTRMRIFNRTPVRHSFLWWENAAVPVNEEYQVFFPPDVSYVNFHYHRSVTSYPIARGTYNGIRFGEGVDIRYHRNTRTPTSFFAAPSRHSFFGGYDHGRHCGVVHVANRHVSPGKKMFTWAYSQLAESWERALTDTDGAYAELMAGSYSDNQPDFAWLEPYETKTFVQCWYPIGGMGVPVAANEHAALRAERSAAGLTLVIQATGPLSGVQCLVRGTGATEVSLTLDLYPGRIERIQLEPERLPSGPLTIRLNDSADAWHLEYSEDPAAFPAATEMPAPWQDLPAPAAVSSVQQLYQIGVHVKQYRDPCIQPDVYWLEALRRMPDHVPSLIALGEYHYQMADPEQALARLVQARRILTACNGNPEDGHVFYLLGLVYQVLDRPDAAYDAFYKASWNGGRFVAAMIRLACLDGRAGQPDAMRRHAEAALGRDGSNSLAGVLAALACRRAGDQAAAREHLARVLRQDPLFELARLLQVADTNGSPADYISLLRGDRAQMVLDLAFDLLAVGEDDLAGRLLHSAGQDPNVSAATPMLLYTAGLLAQEPAQAQTQFRAAGAVTHPACFAFRLEEYAVLQRLVRENPQDGGAWYHLGCLLYSKRQYQQAADCWRRALEQTGSPAVRRNLAVAYYSHLDRCDEVLPLLLEAVRAAPESEQLLYETCLVMTRTGVPAHDRLAYIEAHANVNARGDIILEWAQALSQAGRPQHALDLLTRVCFIPCEGGEHAVAEQYMFAHHSLGRTALARDDAGTALAHFRQAQQLPANLGAGLWHEALLVPHQFYEAACLRCLGQFAAATAIEDQILRLPVDYFANMHLRSLPVWQAAVLLRQGHAEEGDRRLKARLEEWRRAMAQPDAGFFKSTPFFVAYQEDAARQRRGFFAYLSGLAWLGLNEHEQAATALREALAHDPSQLYAWLELELLGGIRQNESIPSYKEEPRP